MALMELIKKNTKAVSEKELMTAIFCNACEVKEKGLTCEIEHSGVTTEAKDRFGCDRDTYHFHIKCKVYL